MNIPLPPMVVAWDVMDRTWAYWAKFGQRVADWLAGHGIDPDPTYRVEFYRLDTAFARVFAYDTDSEGHIPLPPRIVMLAELPPADLLAY